MTTLRRAWAKLFAATFSSIVAVTAHAADIANACRSAEYRRVVDERFAGFNKPDYLR